jgi:hypothetical protein
MPHFDRVVVEPTINDIPVLCQQATEPFGQAPLRWRDPLQEDPLLRRLLDEPAGWSWVERFPRGWDIPPPLIAWWSDAIGRKHVRVTAGLVWPTSPEMKELDAISPLRAPPLTLVYPDACFLKRGPGAPRWQVLCSCGLSGPPAELGWMGDCCAACHDRREEGIESPRLCTVLKGHAAAIDSLVFRPDGTSLAAADGSGDWAIWDLETGSKYHRDVTAARVLRLAGAADGSILTVRWSGIDLIDLSTAPPTVRPVARSVGIAVLRDLAVAPDGQHIAVLTPDRLRVYDQGGMEITSVGTANLLEGPLAFAPDGRLLTALLGRQVALFDVLGRRFLEPIELPGEYVRAQAFAPFGRTLALALSGHASQVGLWDLRQRRMIHTWRLPDNEWVRGNRLLFHPDGRTLLATASGRLVAWDAHTGAVLADLAPRVSVLTELAVSPDGRLVATVAGSTIRLWPIELLTGGRT